MEKSSYKFKVCLFGPGAVGKTSLLIRYIKDYFNSDLRQTIGSSFLIKDVVVDEIDDMVNEELFGLMEQADDLGVPYSAINFGEIVNKYRGTKISI